MSTELKGIEITHKDQGGKRPSGKGGILKRNDGNAPGLKRRLRCASRTRKGDITSGLRDNPGLKREKQSIEGLEKVTANAKRRFGKADEENSTPRRTQAWRSRCGRKRKYFGHTSARQGATKRERNRFNIITSAFDELREVIPQAQHPADGKLSKFATLKLACTYITLLAEALSSEGKMEEVRQELGTYHMSKHDRYMESERSSSSNSGMSEDELFLGDFTDVLFADDNQETTTIYDELAKHSSED